MFLLQSTFQRSVGGCNLAHVQIPSLAVASDQASNSEYYCGLILNPTVGNLQGSTVRSNIYS